MDPYLRFVNGVQAMRRRVAALDIGLGGALGVAADPMPHQIATVRRILGEPHIRHLISDEVGLGKTVQALMIVNALRWQVPRHRTLVISPDNLLSQWQEECWIRGHVMTTIADAVRDGTLEDTASITLARPRDLTSRSGQETRAFTADPTIYDMLIVDEPQTMPREAIQTIAAASDQFRQVLVLSATPRLGDPAWREPILRMIEPEAAALARIENRSVADILQQREDAALTDTEQAADPGSQLLSFLQAGSTRRVIRNGRSDWNEYLPLRCNHEVRRQPLTSERMRYEIAAILLKDADPALGLEGRAWTLARTLQRSGRSARTALVELANQPGTLGELAGAANRALADPGDSRLDALLDILSEQWSEDEDRAFIIVCGDNPTIDLLRAALPRYFPSLSGTISVLRRPAATDVEGVTNLREIQETLAPLLSGESRLLLVGDWVQAGLNLHHVADGIVFFTLPWDIDSIDQLIGRVDRLGANGYRKGVRRVINIWRILIEGSQEAAIADTVAAAGVFDSPLPPLSPQESAELQRLLGLAAIRRKPGSGVRPLTEDAAGLPSRFKGANPFTKKRADADFERWRRKPSPGPVMLSEPAHQKETPVRREERAVRAWMKVITASRDFDIGNRRDRSEDYGFQTIWYSTAANGGRAGESPFDLPGIARDRWMSDHVPFICQRSAISSPPRRSVVTDDGERSGRPLRFFDHGAELHDQLIAGYIAATLSAFGTSGPVQQITVRLPQGHPARGLGPLVVITSAYADPFPDSLCPPLHSPEARRLIETAPTEAQKRALRADRHALQSVFQALQRRARFAAPAAMIRLGSARSAGGWKDMTEEEVDACLLPATAETGNAYARGRVPRFPIESHDVTSEIRTQQRAEINSRAAQRRHSSLNSIRTELEEFGQQMRSQFRLEIRNRELALERRRDAPLEAGPVEFRQGQLASLERSLSMARLNFSEAESNLQDLIGGDRIYPVIQPCTVLLSLVPDD